MSDDLLLSRIENGKDVFYLFAAFLGKIF